MQTTARKQPRTFVGPRKPRRKRVAVGESAAEKKIRRAATALERPLLRYLMNTPHERYSDPFLRNILLMTSVPDAPDRKILIGAFERIGRQRQLTRIQLMEAVRRVIRKHQDEFRSNLAELSDEDFRVLDSAQRILDEELLIGAAAPRDRGALGAREAASVLEKRIKRKPRFAVLEEPAKLRKLRVALSK